MSISRKIEVFPPDKSSGKRVQKVKIYFNFVDDVEIPVISEPVVAKSTPGRRKNGVTIEVTPFSAPRKAK